MHPDLGTATVEAAVRWWPRKCPGPLRTGEMPPTLARA